MNDVSMRDALLGSPANLNKLIKSYKQRLHGKYSDSYMQRFKKADEMLLLMIGKWKLCCGNQVPVFDAWFTYQKEKGLKIPDIMSEMESRLSQSELDLYRVQNRLSILTKDIEKTESQLSQLLEILTPSVEEAFADLVSGEQDTSVMFEMNSSTRPTEQAGINEDIFDTAREKFNYLLKKLIPRLQELNADCEKVVGEIDSEISMYSIKPVPRNLATLFSKLAVIRNRITEVATIAEREAQKIPTSKTYSHFMMLLSSMENTRDIPSTKRRKQVDKGDDREYDDWF
jgi:hypothetical protein